MNELDAKYREQGVGSVFLYTNEAHPGEHYPHLTSFEQKLRHARALRDRLGVTRPIWADSLEGDCHRAYGSMPNMTWIFDRRGTVVYRSDWSDSRSVDDALAMLLGVPERRRAGERAVPFTVERMEYRSADRDRFYEGLALAGPKAVEEFRRAFG